MLDNIRKWNYILKKKWPSRLGVNMLRLEQNDSPFADNILLGIYLNKNISISNKISFKISHTCRFLWVEFVKQ